MDGHKSIHFLLAFLFFFFSLLSTLLMGHSQLLPIVNDQGGNASQVQTFIVHVLKPDGTDFQSAEDRESWHRSFLPSTHLESGEARLIYSYEHAMSGFAARLTPEEVRAMEAMDGFMYAHADRELKIRTTYTPDFLQLNQWQGIWRDSGYGEGIIIGVIDTGIFPTHPSFNDTGMPSPPRKWRGRCDFGPGVCNNKLIGARAFQGGTSPSPMDDHGHGTHTASTAAGSIVYDAHVLGQARGTAVGIAPKAHIAMYKVLYNFRGWDSDILAGIDQAIIDGVDVLSMSLGSGPINMYDSGVIVGSLGAITQGIFPSAAGGNSGPFPSQISNDAPWVLTVGASTTDRRITATVRLGNGMELDGESAYQPSTFSPTLMEIAYPGANGILDFQICTPNALSQLNLQGMIVLCWVGEFTTNIATGEAVKNAGGAAMILLNAQVPALTTSSEAHVLPAAHVNSLNAKKIISYVSTSPSTPTATIIFKDTQFGAPLSPSVAFFSSRGPSLRNGGILKPDIVGPGVNILAAWPVAVGPNPTGSTSTFNFLSGTSMATPHLSGIAAMLKKIYPNWSPAAIKSAIMTTASTVYADGTHYTDQYPDNSPVASMFALGAGHVTPSRAQDPGLIYDLNINDYISYLCGVGFTDKQVSIMVQRRAQCSSVFPISAEQLNYPSISLTLRFGQSKIITRTVTNVGGANSVYTADFVAPVGTAMDVSPKTLSFSSVNERKSFSIQFRTSGTYPGTGHVSEGEFGWVSNKHIVRSPISITFI